VTLVLTQTNKSASYPQTVVAVFI